MSREVHIEICANLGGRTLPNVENLMAMSELKSREVVIDIYIRLPLQIYEAARSSVIEILWMSFCHPKAKVTQLGRGIPKTVRCPDHEMILNIPWL